MSSQDDDKTIVGGALVLTYSLTSQTGEKIALEGIVTIGRSSENTISIDNKKISRKHATIEIVNGRLMVTDLQSGNGTFVNGTQINEKTLLANEDKVSFEQEAYTVNIVLPELKQDPEKKVLGNPSSEQQKTVDSMHENSVAKAEEKVKQAVQQPKNVDEPNPTTNDKKEIPSSWIEDEKPVDGTKMMDPSQLSALKGGVSEELSTNSIQTTRLHSFIDGMEQIIEMPIDDVSKASGWEIGRDKQCDIVLNHVSVSSRHAQIIHQNRRWKIVNLVSTNGIMINEKKQLSGYLSDGDKIGLGSVNLIFKTPDSAKKAVSFGQNTTSSKNNVLLPVVMGTTLIALAVLIYMKLWL